MRKSRLLVLIVGVLFACCMSGCGTQVKITLQDNGTEVSTDTIVSSDAMKEGHSMEEGHSMASDGAGASDTLTVDILASEVYMQITQDEAMRIMKESDGYMIVDVRTKEEYATGHIPGAINIPNEVIGSEKPEELPDIDQNILVYCRSGRRSKEAAQKLAAMGYMNILEFGGIDTWMGEIVVDEYEQVEMKRVTVHDPSVVYDHGMYYIFGSHMAWAKSADLQNWEYFDMNINTEYAELFGREWEAWCSTRSNPELKGNLWAPDVIYNEKMGKYCLYMSVNGDDWNSVIVMLTADRVDGPYSYGGPVVYSGFSSGGKHPAAETDVYRVLGEDADLKRYQSTTVTKLNAIDPCVFYDQEGKLWMSFGSWFGGIYLLKLDEETGLRDYDTVYETAEGVSDAYYGYKIAGGKGVSGEGSYLVYKDGYYYLFVSYGGLVATGGYQIRVFRSENVTGPYVDQNGAGAVYDKAANNLYGKVGIRLMGSYDWTGNREIRVSQGHNSAYVTEGGQFFLVYHSRFADGKDGNAEAHEVRVQQLFINQDGWPVAAPYEYAGERISETGYTPEEMCGEYELIIHEPTQYYRKYGNAYEGIMEALYLNLKEDGKVTGDRVGSWQYEENSPYVELTLDGVTYRGVFLKMPSEQLFEDSSQRKIVMTFTVLGDNITMWGSKK